MTKTRFLLALYAAFALAAVLLLQQGTPGASAGAPLPVSPGALPAPVWGADIRVSALAVPTPYKRKNITLAVNPANTNMVVAGFERSKDVAPNASASSYSTSTDAGRTWTASEWPGPWGTGQMVPQGDVNVAFDGHGVVYASSLAGNVSMNGHFVLTSTNGTTWSQPVEVASSTWNEFRSRSSLLADKRTSGPNAGSVYLFWSYTNTEPPLWHGVRGRYSRDGGATWSGDVQVSGPHNYALGTNAAQGSDGVLYIAWEFTDQALWSNQPELYLARSTDYGVTWSPERLISGAPIEFVGRPDWKFRERVLPAAADCSDLRVDHYPRIAVSPQNSNHVYVVWNDSRWDAPFVDPGCGREGRHSDVAFSRSTDGGQTWSSVVRLNDDTIGNGRDQWLPSINTAPDGTVGVHWYDRRYATDQYLYDVAYTQSTDGGVTWLPNVRISDVSSNPDSLPDYKDIDDLGYRSAIAFGPDYVLPLWMDTRLGERQGDIFTDRGAFDVPSPTPTLTSQVTSTPTTTPTRTTTPTAPPTVTGTPSACTLEFTDVPPENTFYPFVRCLACRGIVSGYPCGSVPGEPCNPNSDPYFRPNNPVTRGQLAKIVSESAGFDDEIPPSRHTFADVPYGSTFWLWVERLSNREVMSGYACGGPNEPCDSENRPYFRPGAGATRGQLTKIVSNAAGFDDTIPSTQYTFTDVPPTHTFWLFVERLLLNRPGVMGGYACGGTGEPCDTENRAYFRPNNPLTRGQTSKIVAGVFFPECTP